MVQRTNIELGEGGGGGGGKVWLSGLVIRELYILRIILAISIYEFVFAL